MLVPASDRCGLGSAKEAPPLLPVEKRLILKSGRAHHLPAGPHRLLYDLLRRVSDEPGETTVTVRQVDLVEAHRSLRTVQNHLCRLAAEHWLTAEAGSHKRRGPDWSSKPNTYTLRTVVERTQKLAQIEAEEAAASAAEAAEVELATVTADGPLIAKSAR